MSRRYDNWPTRFAAFLAEARHRHFEWGTHDCGLFVADAVQAITGIDPAGELRGRYAREREALALGADDLQGLAHGLALACGFEAIAPAMAQRGDVVLYVGPHGPSLGVCNGTTIAAPGPDGLSLTPMAQATHAWRIG